MCRGAFVIYSRTPARCMPYAKNTRRNRSPHFTSKSIGKDLSTGGYNVVIDYAPPLMRHCGNVIPDTRPCLPPKHFVVQFSPRSTRGAWWSSARGRGENSRVGFTYTYTATRPSTARIRSMYGSCSLVTRTIRPTTGGVFLGRLLCLNHVLRTLCNRHRAVSNLDIYLSFYVPWWAAIKHNHYAQPSLAKPLKISQNLKSRPRVPDDLSN